MTTTPSTLDVQDAHVQAALSNLHTCMPAEVLRVYAGEHKQRFVDVQPGLMRAAVDEDGEHVDEQLPVLTMVPGAVRQAGGFFISVRLKVTSSR
jgi:hypothetical protein